MKTEINASLKQLVELWTEGSAASLRRIPGLCCEVTNLAANGEIGGFDPELLRRACRLAVNAEQRLSVCIRIQSQTGTYSTRGELERSPRVITAGWEG